VTVRPSPPVGIGSTPKKLSSSDASDLMQSMPNQVFKQRYGERNRSSIMALTAFICGAARLPKRSGSVATVSVL
jgi:hypothetical protein